MMAKTSNNLDDDTMNNIEQLNSMPIHLPTFPAGIYLLKVNNRIGRTRCEMFLVFVKFEHVIADWVS